MTDLIENTVLDSIQPETKAKKSRAAEKAEYETDIHHSPAFADSHFINKLKEELKTLEKRQELYRQAIGPAARALLQSWKDFLATEERSFVAQNIHLHQDRKPPYLNLASIGGICFFNKSAIADALPALAFSVAGPAIMAQRGDSYYPVVPRMMEIREELERLGV